MKSMGSVRRSGASILAAILFWTVAVGGLLDAARCDAANLPLPDRVLPRSKTFEAPMLKGVRFDPANPYSLTFYIDGADASEVTRAQAKRLIDYFMTALTVPLKDLWVNLSPYERDRVMADGLEMTALGRAFLEEDYLLKLASSSLLHPDTPTGREYWAQMAGARAEQNPGFSKVFVVPQEYEIVVDGDTAWVGSSSVEVLLESDLNARRNAGNHTDTPAKHEEATRAMRESVLPAVRTQVLTGGDFAYMRQIFNSIALAVWFKRTFSAAPYAGYFDARMMFGLAKVKTSFKDEVYASYVRSFENGVFNVVKQGKEGNRRVARHYFSGGIYVPERFVRVRSAQQQDAAVGVGVNGYECRVDVREIGRLGASSSAAVSSSSLRKVLPSILYTVSTLRSFLRGSDGKRTYDPRALLRRTTSSRSDELGNFSQILTDVLGRVKGLATAEVDLKSVYCVVEQNYVKVVVDGVYAGGSQAAVRSAIMAAAEKKELRFMLVKDGKDAASQRRSSVVDVELTDVDFSSQTVLLFKLRDNDYDPKQDVRFCVVEKNAETPSAVFHVLDAHSPKGVHREMEFVAECSAFSEAMLRDNLNDVRALLKTHAVNGIGKNYKDILEAHSRVRELSVRIANRLMKTVAMGGMEDDVAQMYLAYAEQYTRIARYAAFVRVLADCYTAIETQRRSWFHQNSFMERSKIAFFLRFIFGVQQIYWSNMKDIKRLLPNVVTLGNTITEGMYPGADGSSESAFDRTYADVKAAVEGCIKPSGNEGIADKLARYGKQFSKAVWVLIPLIIPGLVTAIVGAPAVAAAAAAGSVFMVVLTYVLPGTKYLHDFLQASIIAEVRDHDARAMFRDVNRLESDIATYKRIANAPAAAENPRARRAQVEELSRIAEYSPKKNAVHKKFFDGLVETAFAVFSPVPYLIQNFRKYYGLTLYHDIERSAAALSGYRPHKGMLAVHFDRMTRRAAQKEKHERSVDYVYVVCRHPEKTQELTDMIRATLGHDVDVRIVVDQYSDRHRKGGTDARTMLEAYEMVQPGKRGFILDFGQLEDSFATLTGRIDVLGFDESVLTYKLLTGVRFCQKLKTQGSDGFAVIGGSRVYVGPIFVKDGVNGHFVWANKADASKGSFVVRSRTGNSFYRNLDLSDKDSWDLFTGVGHLDRFDQDNETVRQFLKRAPLTTYVGDVSSYQSFFRELRSAITAYDSTYAENSGGKFIPMEQEMFYTIPLMRSLARRGSIESDIGMLRSSGEHLAREQRIALADVCETMTALRKKYFDSSRVAFNVDVPTDDESALYAPVKDPVSRRSNPYQRLVDDIDSADMPMTARRAASALHGVGTKADGYGGITLEHLNVRVSGRPAGSSSARAAHDTGLKITVVSLKKIS